MLCGEKSSYQCCCLLTSLTTKGSDNFFNFYNFRTYETSVNNYVCFYDSFMVW